MALFEQVSSFFKHGRKSGIGTSAVQMVTISMPTYFGVLVKTSINNTGIVYVGNANVSADADDITSGFELSAGESVTLKVDNVNLVYCIASASSQKVYWVIV